MQRSDKTQVAPFFLRTREAAAFLGVSESQIAIWTRSGVLTTVKFQVSELFDMPAKT